MSVLAAGWLLTAWPFTTRPATLSFWVVRWNPVASYLAVLTAFRVVAVIMPSSTFTSSTSAVVVVPTAVSESCVNAPVPIEPVVTSWGTLTPEDPLP